MDSLANKFRLDVRTSDINNVSFNYINNNYNKPNSGVNIPNLKFRILFYFNKVQLENIKNTDNLNFYYKLVSDLHKMFDNDTDIDITLRSFFTNEEIRFILEPYFGKEEYNKALKDMGFNAKVLVKDNE